MPKYLVRIHRTVIQETVVIIDDNGRIKAGKRGLAKANALEEHSTKWKNTGVVNSQPYINDVEKV